MSDGSRAVGAAAVTVVLWASAFVAIRSAGGHFTPGALALGRLLVASLALGVVWLLSGAGWPARAAWPGILGSGLLWFGLYMVTLNWGERDVDAGTAAMLVNIGPILIALLGGWLLHEGFPRRLAAGMAVSFGGATVVGISESGGGHASVIGVVLCLVAAVPSGDIVATGDRGGNIYLWREPGSWSAADQRPAAVTLPGRTGEYPDDFLDGDAYEVAGGVNAVAFSPDGTTLATDVLGVGAYLWKVTVD